MMFFAAARSGTLEALSAASFKQHTYARSYLSALYTYSGNWFSTHLHWQSLYTHHSHFDATINLNSHRSHHTFATMKNATLLIALLSVLSAVSAQRVQQGNGQGQFIERVVRQDIV